MRSITTLGWLLLVTLCAAPQALAVDVEGRIALPDATARDARLVLALNTGRVLHTYTLPGGKFSFQNVPAGKHYLDVELVGLVFPTLEVTVEESGDVHALSVDLSGRPPAAIPLTLKPVGKIDFFESQQAFNIMGFLKTPYGIMIAFMVFSIFILPSLRSALEEPQAEGAAATEQPAVAAPSPRRKIQ